MVEPGCGDGAVIHARYLVTSLSDTTQGTDRVTVGDNPAGGRSRQRTAAYAPTML